MVISVLKRWTFLPGLICVMAAAGACEPRVLEPQGEYAYAESGPFSVQDVESLTLADRQRGTDVLVRVYYPNGDGPFPVIAFSHSVNGSKDLFGAISTHWASHGYVVVHPTHDDTGVRMGPDGMQPPAEKVRERLRDVTAVLDALDQIESSDPGPPGKARPQHGWLLPATPMARLSRWCPVASPSTSARNLTRTLETHGSGASCPSRRPDAATTA